jgi:hypothetical protein
MEFGIIGVVVFTMFFAIFDLGRYAITLHSLSMLAHESARAEIICYSPYIAANNLSAANCSGDPLSAASKQAVAPFLYLGGLAPSVCTAASTSACSSGTIGAGPHVVTASQPGFSMIMPFWPSTMNAPSTSISLPF